jgi:hypothetical protein
MQSIAIWIWLGRETGNVRLFGRHSVEMVFREKQIHPVIITKRKPPAFVRKQAVGLQIYQETRIWPRKPEKFAIFA